MRIVKTLTGLTHTFKVQSSRTAEDIMYMWEASHLGCGAWKPAPGA